MEKDTGFSEEYLKKKSKLKILQPQDSFPKKDKTIPQCAFVFERRKCKNNATSLVRVLLNGETVNVPVCEDHHEKVLADNWKENFSLGSKKEENEESDSNKEKSGIDIGAEKEEYRKTMINYFAEFEISIAQRKATIKHLEVEIKYNKEEIALLEQRRLLLMEGNMLEENRFAIEKKDYLELIEIID